MDEFDEFLEYLEQEGPSDFDDLYDTDFDAFLESEESSDYGDYLRAERVIPPSIDETHRQMALDILTNMTQSEINRMTVTFIENGKQKFSFVALPQELHLVSV